MAWRGLAIGVLISAPMGPVGMLCIQRTLDKGRKAGFYTGIGAAASDLIYCLITGFFLSLIEDFLQENQNIIQLIGSLVLIAFSVYLFKKSPSASLRRPVSQNVSAKKSILGGFLFTFSNPLIIFLIIGLFARFNFSAPEINGGYYAVGYLFLVAGALGWWYGVTYLIDKVRSRFNMRSMKRLNILIGLVILAFACVGIITSIIGLATPQAKAASIGNPPYKAISLTLSTDENESVSPAPEYENAWRINNTGKEAISLDILDRSLIRKDAGDYDVDSITQFQLDFKIASDSGRKSKHKVVDADGKSNGINPSWHLLIVDSAGSSIDLAVGFGECWPTQLSSQKGMIITSSVNGAEIETRPLIDGVAMRGLNHFRVVYAGNEGIRICAGTHSLDKDILIKECGEKLSAISRVQLSVESGADITILQPQLRLATSPSAKKTTMSLSDIDARIRATNDPLEGRWKVFDYSLDDKSMKSGGDYAVDVVRNPEGLYEIVNHSGGIVNEGKWKRGYIKGFLSPTGHEGVYSLEWRDVEGSTVATQGTVQQETIDLIAIHFPALNSQLRLKRLAAGK